MSVQPTAILPIYQADSTAVQAIQQCRAKLHHICRQHMNRPVQIQTLQGQVHTGMMVGIDDHYLYLDMSATAGMRYPIYPPYPQYPPYTPYDPYASSIVPLVLFNLLAISLL
jgi:hypothetical protein